MDAGAATMWIAPISPIGLTIRRGSISPHPSVEQAKYCYNNGYVVDLDDLRPGDLLYWQKTSCHCGRWHEIHHAGIYLGNGLVIEASSSQGCVVIRSLWGQNGGGEWRLYMAARPYTEETPEMDRDADTGGSGCTVSHLT